MEVSERRKRGTGSPAGAGRRRARGAGGRGAGNWAGMGRMSEELADDWPTIGRCFGIAFVAARARIWSMTVEELSASAERESEAPEGLSPELRALWLTKAGRWDDAHGIAQDIPSAMGSWIHALLHLIEGDLGNSGYWYQRAGKPARQPSEIDAEWEAIAAAALEKSGA